MINKLMRYIKLVKYTYNNWKLMVHVLLRTKRFGVNNEWKSHFDSQFGVSTPRIIWDVITIKQIIYNYKCAKYRASIGFVHPDTYKLLYGEDLYKNVEWKNDE